MNDVLAEARATLSTKARSFRWGAVFLPAAARDDAAIVYGLCRLIDDTVDEATDPVVAAAEARLLEDELTGARPPRPLVAAWLEVQRRRGMSLTPALELLHGVVSDLGPVRLRDDAALLRYCYEVAGTVGLMMSGVLGVTDPAASQPAIDLGRAMQLTNICRDVAEDAGLGRVYLPEERLRAAGTSPEAVLARTAEPERVGAVIRDLLDLADTLYARADAGMGYIPWRSRLAIRVARRLYAGIGDEIRRQGCDPWRGRAVVRPSRKLVLVGRAFSDMMRAQPVRLAPALQEEA